MRDFMIALLICSATTSALGLLYMALTPALARRYSTKWGYYAWLIIVVGFIIPFRPHFADAIVVYDLPESVPYFSSGTIMTAVQQEIIESSTTPIAASSISLWHIVFSIWLTGLIAFVAFHVIRHHRLMKMTARWSNGADCCPEAALLERLKAEMGIQKQIGLYRCPSVGSPMLLGVIKPRILLPQTPIPRDDLEFIVRHELIHYKRNDLWFKCATLFAVAIHWFNPAVYLLAKAIDAACELSCDAETMRNADMDARQRYSEAIIGVVRYQSKLKTALSTNFYGGKNGMKKRIHSIMDSERKKPGITILCCMFILTMATGMAFATSATEPKGTTYEQTDRLLNAQAVSEADQSMMSRFDPETGLTYYSWDLGKTWTQLTNEEYDAMFPSPVVEWWTYDGYKAWMEEQVNDLQALADDGVPDYYDKDGNLCDFVQADVDEAAALYQSILADIKNGHKVSKTVDGLVGTMMSYDPQDILKGTTETYAIVEDRSYAETVDFGEYALYGLRYDARTGDYYYNGKLVRRFYDERDSSTVTRTFNPNGVVDITANRNDESELIGLYKHSQQEFDERTKAMRADTSGRVAEQYAVATVQAGEELAYDYSKYAAYGLTCNTATDNLYYKGELVRYFEDSYPLGENMVSYVNHFDIDGTIDVHAIRDLSKIVHNPDGSYDPSGVLVGVSPYSQAEFNARDITQYVYDNIITQIAIGESIEEDLRPYKNFGVSYDSHAGVMMYDGAPVREIYDPHLRVLITLSNGTGFPVGIIPEGATDLTAVYENGILTGFKKSTREEFDARTQNRLATATAVAVVQDTAETNQSPIASEAYAGTLGATSDASSGSSAYSASSTVVYDNTAVTSETGGHTFEQIFERYRAYGITFDPNSVMGGLGNIYYNGKLVKSFVDINPNGGVISCSSSDGGEITVRTIYSYEGELTRLEVAAE